jgi:Tol biopolymer transport system component
MLNRKQLPLEYRRIVLYAFALSIVITLLSLVIAPLSHAQDIGFTDKEIVRNGDFEHKTDAWYQFRCDYGSWYAKSGEYGLRLGSLTGILYEERYFFQQLILPSQLDSATISLDYRSDEITFGDALPVKFDIVIAKSAGFESWDLEETPPLEVLGVIHSETIDTAFDWRTFNTPLDPALIAQIQAAHTAGEYLFLLVSQTKTGVKHGFETEIDNLSIKVSGTQSVPTMEGKIAFLQDGDDGDPSAIAMLDPNDRSVTQIWAHPEGTFREWSNVAWNPEATRLAFVSDHDFQFSVFKSNIFSVKPDGSDVHRIPNTPTRQEIEEGDYPRVTVKGVLKADTGIAGDRYNIIMGVQGTKAGTSLVVSGNETVSFTIPDVPVLDSPDSFNQALILTYSSTTCNGGIEYAFPVGSVEGGSVDLGTVHFYGSNCIGKLISYRPFDLSWSHDGGDIGFTLLGLRKINVKATQEFDLTTIESQGSGFSSNMAWSPVDDRYLYLDANLSSGGDDLFIAEEGVEPTLLAQHVADITPSWLPDGSAFLYVGWPMEETLIDDHNIFQYDLTTGQIKQLTYFRNEHLQNLSISPDGRHLIFERHDQILNPKRDLWMMNRLNPVDIWRITQSGEFRAPNWSRKTVSMDSDAQDDDDTIPPDEDNTTPSHSGSNGGGGCYISSCWP